MPIFNCSPSVQAGVTRSVQLVVYDALVPLVVRSESGSERKLQARIDTGSEYTVIEEDLAKQLQLVVIDQMARQHC